MEVEELVGLRRPSHECFGTGSTIGRLVFENRGKRIGNGNSALAVFAELGQCHFNRADGRGVRLLEGDWALD